MKRRILLFTPLYFLGLLMVTNSPVLAATSKKVCSASSTTRRAHCLAQVKLNGSVPLVSQSPGGYGPSDFKAAYGGGNGATHVAVVVAYNAPNIQADLNTYSKAFGLPQLPACSAGAQTGCFAKLNQSGGTAYPSTNASWALEASMDVEAVHAACPRCRITLVEATSPSYDNLAAAVDTAVAVGAKIISNSYGSAEAVAQKSYDAHYKRAGVLMTVSSGDSGYGTSWPATSPDVLAVGGTTLHLSGGRVASEAAWSGAGSGCSAYEPKPSWQHDTSCARRSVADVAAVADPATGAAVYDSYPVSGQKGWFTVGGTSLASPLVAGLIAAHFGGAVSPSAWYGSSLVRDISSGRNGSCKTYFCSAGAAYDGPTGLGVLKL